MNKEDLICEGLRILEIIDFERTKQEYYSWKAKVKTAVSTSSLSDAVQKNIFVNLHFVENEYSIEDSKKSLRSSIENVIQLLDSSDITAVSDFEEYTACQIIEKVLSNFYMYIKAMYKDPVHKKVLFPKICSTHFLSKTNMTFNDYCTPGCCLFFRKPVWKYLKIMATVK